MMLSVPTNESLYYYKNSCVAGVLQMLAKWYYGVKLSLDYAVEFTNCTEDGARFHVLSKCLVMKRKYLKTFKEVRAAIDMGHPVIAAETKLYNGPHAILIVGYDEKGFFFNDPASSARLWRSRQWFQRHAGEYEILRHRIPNKRLPGETAKISWWRTLFSRTNT